MLEAYEVHPDAFTSTAAERAELPLSWWEARLVPGPLPPEIVFGAFQGDELAGAAGLLFESREKIRHRATLYGMYVSARFRRRGLGRQLVLAALDHARARPGVKRVLLSVTEGNVGARTLYESCGFVAFGVEPRALAVGTALLGKVHMGCDVDGGEVG